MKAIRIHEFGGVEVLKHEDAPEPHPRAGQVLVKVHAAGVNYADILTRRGAYLKDIRFPFTPGFEISGTVARLGEGVSELRVGQRVMGTIPRDLSGGYAEYAVAPAWLLMPIPDDFTFEEGGAFPEAFITANIALSICAEVDAGETVLIHAAAGGVGTAAVQIAKTLRVTVFATASSDEKLRKVKELGADEIINYRVQDFVKEIKQRTNGRGVDVVLESVGGEVFANSLNCLVPMGRLIVFGVSSGEVPQVEVRQLMSRNIKLVGFTFGNLTTHRPDIVRKATDQVLTLGKERRIHPVLGHAFKLKEAGDAHNLISSRGNYGKVILTP